MCIAVWLAITLQDCKRKVCLLESEGQGRVMATAKLNARKLQVHQRITYPVLPIQETRSKACILFANWFETTIFLMQCGATTMQTKHVNTVWSKCKSKFPKGNKLPLSPCSDPVVDSVQRLIYRDLCPCHSQRTRCKSAHISPKLSVRFKALKWLFTCQPLWKFNSVLSWERGC